LARGILAQYRQRDFDWNLATYYDSTYFDIYTDPDGKIPLWLGFFWPWVVFGYPTYASTSKRLADLDIEPMLALGLLAIIIIPYVGPILQVGMWIWIVAMPGTEGSNKFGLKPRWMPEFTSNPIRPMYTPITSKSRW